jgi:hypothetical protein
MTIKFLLKEISDFYVRENFEKLLNFFKDKPFLEKWQVFEIDFDSATANGVFRHTLGSVPKDIIQTSKTGAGNVTFNYELFDRDFINLTTTGPCKVRFLVGNLPTGG